jgi:hypothetical protein
MIIKNFNSIKNFSKIKEKKGYSVTFNGTDEAIVVSHNASIDFAHTDSFTFSLFIEIDADSEVDRGFVKSDGTRGYSFGVTTNRKFFLSFTDSGVTKIRGFSTTALALNTRYQIGGTWDGSNDISGLNLYLNGVSEALTSTTNNPISNLKNTVDLSMGANSGLTAFSDYIGSNFMIANTEFSAEDMSKLISGSCPTDLRYHPKVDNIVMWLQIDENDTGSSVNDKIGSNNGVPSNMDSSNFIENTSC